MFNRLTHRITDRSYPSKISLISRGELLNWCKESGVSLWPSELRDTRSFLELFLSDPKNILPAKQLSQLISKVLALEPHEAKLSGKPEFQRVVTSAALLTGIATSGFAEAENHFSVASAWTLLVVSVIAAAEKHGFKLNGAVMATLQLAEAAAGEALTQLWNEVKDRKHLVEGNALADPDIYGWRYATILGLLSCLAILDESTPLLTDDSRAELKQWLLQRPKNVELLWGEGAVASLVPWFVWLRKHDPTLKPDLEIAALTEAIITRNQPRSTSPLVGPYYNFEEVARFSMKLDKAGKASALGRETIAGSTFTAEALLHLLVRTNLKQKCKLLWPDFTRLSNRVCLPDSTWEYCTLHVTSGIEQTKIYPPTYNWADLKAEALQRDNSIPAEMAARPWLLALWWQVAPYRYTTMASRVFAEGVLPGWGA